MSTMHYTGTYTFGELRAYLDEYGIQGTGEGWVMFGRGLYAELEPGVSIHDHPRSVTPREIHLLVDGEKVAELGADYVYELTDKARILLA